MPYLFFLLQPSSDEARGPALWWLGHYGLDLQDHSIFFNIMQPLTMNVSPSPLSIFKVRRWLGFNEWHAMANSLLGPVSFKLWRLVLLWQHTRILPGLFKLTQRGSINDYPLDFESFASRIISLLAPFLLSCFISGLALEIRPEV